MECTDNNIIELFKIESRSLNWTVNLKPDDFAPKFWTDTPFKPDKRPDHLSADDFKSLKSEAETEEHQDSNAAQQVAGSSAEIDLSGDQENTRREASRLREESKAEGKEEEGKLVTILSWSMFYDDDLKIHVEKLKKP